MESLDGGPWGWRDSDNTRYVLSSLLASMFFSGKFIWWAVGVVGLGQAFSVCFLFLNYLIGLSYYLLNGHLLVLILFFTKAQSP